MIGIFVIAIVYAIFIHTNVKCVKYGADAGTAGCIIVLKFFIERHSAYPLVWRKKSVKSIVLHIQIS